MILSIFCIKKVPSNWTALKKNEGLIDDTVAKKP